MESSVRKVVQKWSETISIHGLPHVVAPGWKMWWRAVWLLLFLSCFGVMTWQISNLISDFRNYETTYSFEKQELPQLDFPEITLCNANAYSSSAKLATGIEVPRSQQQVELLSQRWQNFMLEWSFNGRRVSAGDADFALLTNDDEDDRPGWRAVMTPIGRCFKFNDGGRGVRRPNGAGGLAFAINIEQGDYDLASVQSGVFVFVQEPGVPVSDEVNYSTLPPGRYTHLSVKRTRWQRETDEPWSTCKDQAPDYTQSHCRWTLLNELVADMCGCRRLGDADVSRASLPICAQRLPLDFNTLECDALRDFFADESADVDFGELLAARCAEPPCQEHELIVSAGQLSYPSVRSADALSRHFNLTARQIEQNIVVGDVNFGSLSEIVIVESKKETVSQLLANIGGQLGMFLGISFVSLFEVFGDLLFFRLLPRLFSHDQLEGIAKKD